MHAFVLIKWQIIEAQCIITTGEKSIIQNY